MSKILFPEDKNSILLVTECGYHQYLKYINKALADLQEITFSNDFLFFRGPIFHILKEWM